MAYKVKRENDLSKVLKNTHFPQFSIYELDNSESKLVHDAFIYLSSCGREIYQFIFFKLLIFHLCMTAGTNIKYASRNSTHQNIIGI